MLPPLIQIGDILLSSDIISECFSCDYDRCGGACCVEGDSGAPLDALPGSDEAAALSKSYPAYRIHLGKEGDGVLAGGTFSTVDADGDRVTPLVPGSAECVYCHRNANGGLMCAVEMAGCRKPVSCSLYPIRVRILSSGLVALNLHRWDICRCAFEKGRREGVRVYEFLRGPLSEAFGDEFLQALDAARRELED